MVIKIYTDIFHLLMKEKETTMVMKKKKLPQLKRKKTDYIMFRISPELKEKVLERSEENNCTMTSYIEYLIQKDMEENYEPKRPKRHRLL